MKLLYGSRSRMLLGLLGWGLVAACGGKSSAPRDQTGSTTHAGVGGGGDSGSGAGGSGAGGSGAGRSSAGTSGAGGSGASGRGGDAGTAGQATAGAPPSCEEVQAEAAAELESIQRCMTADECGQVITGSSCGCTHDLVARTDADVRHFRELMDTNCLNLLSFCDCPPANGFACMQNRCTWNYTSTTPSCTPATPYTLCVVGIPIDAGDLIQEGMPLTVTLRPSGCYSSSCTTADARYSYTETADGDIELEGELCLSSADPGTGCTADCGGGQGRIETGQPLTKGTHTVRVLGPFDLSVTFTVPSIVSDGSLCAAMDQ